MKPAIKLFLKRCTNDINTNEYMVLHVLTTENKTIATVQILEMENNNKSEAFKISVVRRYISKFGCTGSQCINKQQ